MSIPARRARVSKNRPAKDQIELPFGTELAFELGVLPPDCCAIPLTNGGYALVDEEDLCRVDEHEWKKGRVFTKHGFVYYACRFYRHEGKKTRQYMHRQIYGLTPADDIEIDHKNHDGLDNRRSRNLRIATSSQNALNRRKLKSTSSRYKGVFWKTLEKKWGAAINASGVLGKYISLGSYEIEEEAAIAASTAYEIVYGKELLALPQIPDDLLPYPQRQAEIRRLTISKIKRLCAGEKGRLDATSKYYGVAFGDRDGKWIGYININKIHYALGWFDTEEEAAFAYNVAVSVLHPSFPRHNEIDQDHAIEPQKAEQIRLEVVARIELKQSGPRRVPQSTYHGIGINKDNGLWRVGMRYGRKNLHLGFFESETLAALAYNFGIAILPPSRAKPNIIPADVSIDPARASEIHEEVKTRLEAIIGGRKGTPGVTSNYVGVTRLDRKNLVCRWLGKITFKGQQINIGFFLTETEAAIAYNFAIANLPGTKAKPNPIPADQLPSPETVAAVRAKVEARFAKILPIE